MLFKRARIISAETPVGREQLYMSAAPERYRAARLAVPRLPLPAILSFAVAGLGGALFLAYTGSYKGADPVRVAASPNDVPVYSVRAVPLDAPIESVAERANSVAQATSVARIESRRAETNEPGSEATSSGPIFLSDASRELKGFRRFANFGAANTYLTLTATTFGMSAQMNAPNYFAPDAETAATSAVPEPSAWLSGAALFALVFARGLRALWHRGKRR